jgi:hypothetical protein
MSRQTSPQLAHRHDGFLHWIRDLAADQPFWLCRRLCTPRRFIAWHLVPIRRSLRLRREPRFGVDPIARVEAKRTPEVQPSEAQQAVSGWGIDQTMVLWRTFGVSIAWVVRNGYIKAIVG